MSEEYPSTYPQNIAYEAAKMADLFLYLMRAATAAFAEVTSRRDVQIRIAENAGIDPEKFTRHLDDGSAGKAFEQDLLLTARAGASGFPTFIIQYGDKAVRLNGYHPYETFSHVISTLSDGKIRPEEPAKTEEALLSFMQDHPMMAAEEIRQAFDFRTKQEAVDFVRPLVSTGGISLLEAGNGTFAVKSGVL